MLVRSAEGMLVLGKVTTCLAGSIKKLENFISAAIVAVWGVETANRYSPDPEGISIEFESDPRLVERRETLTGSPAEDFVMTGIDGAHVLDPRAIVSVEAMRV